MPNLSAGLCCCLLDCWPAPPPCSNEISSRWKACLLGFCIPPPAVPSTKQLRKGYIAHSRCGHCVHCLRSATFLLFKFSTYSCTHRNRHRAPRTAGKDLAFKRKKKSPRIHHRGLPRAWPEFSREETARVQSMHRKWHLVSAHKTIAR